MRKLKYIKLFEEIIWENKWLDPSFRKSLPKSSKLPSLPAVDYEELSKLSAEDLQKIIGEYIVLWDGGRPAPLETLHPDDLEFYKKYVVRHGKEKTIRKLRDDELKDFSWKRELPMEYRKKPVGPFSPKFPTLTRIADDIKSFIHNNKESDFLEIIKKNIDEGKELSDNELKVIFSKLKSIKYQHEAVILNEIDELLGQYITTEK